MAIELARFRGDITCQPNRHSDNKSPSERLVIRMSVRLTSEIATKSRQANGQGVKVGHGIPLRLGGVAFRAMAKVAIPPNLRGLPDPYPSHGRGLCLVSGYCASSVPGLCPGPGLRPGLDHCPGSGPGPGNGLGFGLVPNPGPCSVLGPFPCSGPGPGPCSGPSSGLGHGPGAWVWSLVSVLPLVLVLDLGFCRNKIC